MLYTVKITETRVKKIYVDVDYDFDAERKGEDYYEQLPDGLPYEDFKDVKVEVTED